MKLKILEIIRRVFDRNARFLCNQSRQLPTFELFSNDFNLLARFCRCCEAPDPKNVTKEQTTNLVNNTDTDSDASRFGTSGFTITGYEIRLVIFSHSD